MSTWVGRVSFYGSLGVLVLVFGVFLHYAGDSARFPLKKVEIYPVLEDCAASDIQATVLPFLKQGFFGLQVHALQQELQGLPWLRSVDVRRLWPDRILLSVEEKKPQAQWGQKGVLSTEGVIFYPPKASIPGKLPHFKGPDERAKEMLEKYLKLLEIVAPLGLGVRVLDLSDQGEWRVILNNGVCLVLGPYDFETRLNRFKIAYQNNLYAQSQKIAYIDLRYTNGLAVGWKEIDVQ